VESALKRRRHQPIFMVDIAVPRDIEAEVANLEDVYLYTVDDLEEVIQGNLRSRQEAAEQAREIIQFQVDEFLGWMRSLDAVGLIQDYRRQANQIRDEVLAKAQRMLEGGRPADEVLHFLAQTLTNKLLHTPSAQLREAGSNGQHDLLEAANALFQLGQGKSGER
jgi:glutamyl-tRNA reductase